MNTIWNDTLTAFTAAVGSSEPTPGGGSVSIVTATMGTALNLMALQITEKHTGPTPPLSALINNCNSSMSLLKVDADEDIASFRALMTALHMPPGPERDKAVEAAATRATKAPLAAVLHCTDAINTITQSAPICVAQLLSDLQTSLNLLAAAAQSDLLNVGPNLSLIKDPAIIAQLSEQYATEQAALGPAIATANKAIADRKS